jgi:hypothetical protein
MNLSPYSYNSTAINDGTNYRAYLPGASAMNQIAPDVRRSPRNRAYPLKTATVFKAREITLNIQMLTAAPHAQVSILNALFDVTADTELSFICKDAENSNKQWYLKVLPVRVNIVGAVYTVTLGASFGLWRSVTQQSDLWQPTASAQTHAVSPTVAGNVPAVPIIRLKPTAQKTGLFPYRRLCLVTNPTTDTLRFAWDVTSGGFDTTALIADNSNKCQLNGAINNSVTTIPYDTVTGSLPSAGTGYLDTEQITWTGKTGTTSGNLTGVTRGVGGTSAASHLDNAVVYVSKTLANGADFRVYLDGIEIDRWFGTGANAFNQAATKVWSNITFNPQVQLTVDGAIANTGAVSVLAIQDTTANRTAILNLPGAGYVLIGSEVFTYSAVNTAKMQLTGCTRAVLGTSMASHSSGDTLKWMEHVIYLVYGDSTLSAPSTNDSKKPIFALTSTNTSLVFTTMSDAGGQRTGDFSGAILARRGPQTTLYTATQDAVADPATALGMSIRSYQVGSQWQAETADLTWQLVITQGVTTVTSNGKKYRNQGSWPSNAKLQYSNPGGGWNDAWNESSPTINTWTVWTNNGVALGATYQRLRFHFSGGISGGSGNEASFETLGMTLTLDSSRVPTFTVGGELTTYDLDVTISNSASGDQFRVLRKIDLNQTLEVDCANRVCTYLADNTPGPIAIIPYNQPEWLRLNPGVTNTLTITEAGLTALDVTILYEDRENS